MLAGYENITSLENRGDRDHTHQIIPHFKGLLKRKRMVRIKQVLYTGC